MEIYRLKIETIPDFIEINGGFKVAQLWRLEYTKFTQFYIRKFVSFSQFSDLKARSNFSSDIQGCNLSGMTNRVNFK